MEQQETITTEQLILDQAAWSFGRERNIRNALHDLRDHPEKLLQRRAEFDLVIRRLNSLGALSGVDNPLPTLSELACMIQFPPQGEPPTIASLARSRIFTIIRDLIAQGDWEYVRDLWYPEVLTSTLLIEGYALMLEEHLSNPDIGRLFVLAFEEILWTELRGTSVILEDVIAWMIDERNSFPQDIRRELEISYLIMSSNSLARYLGEPISINMQPDLIRIYRELPDFDIVSTHCEARFVRETSEEGTVSLLLRMLSEPGDINIEVVIEDIKNIITQHCYNASAQQAAPRYGRAVIYVDVCIPDQYKKEIEKELSDFNVNNGYIDVSIHNRNQKDLLELVWISSR